MTWPMKRGDNGRVKTLRLTLDPAHPDTASETLEAAAALLRRGGLVALPTETVYGLGANALDAEAVGRIFTAKKRPSWDPVIVHIADLTMLDGLVEEIPAAARRLMDAFWPGPLTLLLRRTSRIPDAVTAGRPLVGVRMPAHPVALALIRQAGVPVAAPSANLFSHISPTSAAHVLADLDGRIDAILDAGPAEHGVESTVVDPTVTPLRIYRPGAITLEEIQAIAGPAELHQHHGELVDGSQESEAQSRERAGLPSPGVGLRHYAPQARLILIDAAASELPARILEAAASWSPERIGVMLPGGVKTSCAGAVIYPWGRWNAPKEMARALYAGLRSLDEAGCTVILAPLPPAAGIGAAIRDRMRKAAFRTLTFKTS
jgi:L-threonylcarbamoyladenylate synthase